MHRAEYTRNGMLTRKNGATLNWWLATGIGLKPHSTVIKSHIPICILLARTDASLLVLFIYFFCFVPIHCQPKLVFLQQPISRRSQVICEYIKWIYVSVRCACSFLPLFVSLIRCISVVLCCL